jgi:WD repeat and SOF domain-containing protein 1
MSSQSLTSLDHHWLDPQFATSGETVSIWDHSQSGTPLHSYKWGCDSVLSVKFNPAEACLLASTGSDRGVCLYDLRAAVPMTKFIMAMNANKICWNPREPLNFVAASEDHNLYSFDMRKLDKALLIHKDHVSAVLDVSFSPTGREFVSGSYDRTVRIFKATSGRSREVYHTKRMQRVFCVDFSSDARYVLSGSDDTNVRIWKAEASQALGVTSSREERKKHYLGALKARYSHMPEVKRMNHEKKVPKVIKKAKAIAQIQKTSERRKTDNRKRHSSAEDSAIQPDRKKAVIKELK